MKSAIITGATGSIGTALIEQLISKNIEVLVFCRENSKRNTNIPDNPLVTKRKCSLEDLSSVENDTGKNYDVFYHFGWDGTTGSARNDMYLQNRNIRYTLDAVNVAEKFGCKRFIGAGSQAEYGRVDGILTPDTPTFPEMGYGIGKLCAGQMSRVLCEEKKIIHIWTRILSVYGPCDGASSMVMSTIRKLLKGEKPSFTKGEQLWDYLYSKDAAKAMYLLGEKGISGKTYCIGSGTTQTLKEYIETIKNQINPNADMGYGEIPYSEKQVMHLCADIENLVKDTGFEADYSFEEGIKETIEWFQKTIEEKI